MITSSLSFFCSPLSKTRDTQMSTRVTDGARRERHEKYLSFSFSARRPHFARLAASPLPRACIALNKSEEKERLL